MTVWTPLQAVLHFGLTSYTVCLAWLCHLDTFADKFASSSSVPSVNLTSVLRDADLKHLPNVKIEIFSVLVQDPVYNLTKMQIMHCFHKSSELHFNIIELMKCPLYIYGTGYAINKSFKWQRKHFCLHLMTENKCKFIYVILKDNVI